MAFYRILYRKKKTSGTTLCAASDIWPTPVHGA